jgi:hypothetical protein
MAISYCNHIHILQPTASTIYWIGFPAIPLLACSQAQMDS